MGRYKGRLTSLFENPELGKHTRAVADRIHNTPRNTALDFQRSYDLDRISMVIATPPLASLIFAIVWIQTFVHENDLQVVVTTAFTGATYIITSGESTRKLSIH